MENINKIVFKPSQVHQGYYVYINNISTDIVVNLYAYETIEEYKNKVDEKIEKFKLNNNDTTRKSTRTC